MSNTRRQIISETGNRISEPQQTDQDVFFYETSLRESLDICGDTLTRFMAEILMRRHHMHACTANIRKVISIA